MLLSQAFGQLAKQKSIEYDEGQLQVIAEMVQLERQLHFKKLKFRFLQRLFKANNPSGLYLWGQPGGGKTMLIETFCNHLRKQGVHTLELHQHDFNTAIRAQLNAISNTCKNPLIKIVEQWSKHYQLIFLDDVHLTDIVGVELFKQIWTETTSRGMYWLISANRPPHHLYQGGVGRENFLSTIEHIKNSMQVYQLNNRDYRQNNSQPLVLEVLGYEENLIKARKLFGSLTLQNMTAASLLIQHREINVLGHTQDLLCIDFLTLCLPPRSQNDYSELAQGYSTVIITNMQTIAPENHNLAISWIRCIDIFYNHGVKLYLLSQVPFEAIYPQGLYDHIYQRTSSRLQQMVVSPR